MYSLISTQWVHACFAAKAAYHAAATNGYRINSILLIRVNKYMSIYRVFIYLFRVKCENPFKILWSVFMNMNMEIEDYGTEEYLVLTVLAGTVEAYQASFGLWATLAEIYGDEAVDFSPSVPGSLKNPTGNHIVTVTL